MSEPSQQPPARLIPAQMEEADGEIPHAELISSSAAAGVKFDGSCSLSGDKPFFHVILTKSHVEHPHRLAIPADMAPKFPRIKVPMVLTHGGKEWNVSFLGNLKRPILEYSDWRGFVRDNNLKCDDVCIFEIMELRREIIRLRVIFLRETTKLPPEMAALFASRGTKAETPIVID